MAYREVRASLFRLATAFLFVAAIVFLRTQTGHAEIIWYSTCEELELTEFVCELEDGEDVGCAEYQDCYLFTGTTVPSLCYCMAPDNCGWWPGGCGE